MTGALYRALTRLLRRFAPPLARPGTKLHEGLAGRADAHEELARWGRDQRDPSRPLLWFHAPSVGEGLQAQAVIEAFRKIAPDAQIAFTHFSPSARALAARIGADVAAYLPWDLPETVEPALEGLRPSALVFTKTEVWPSLIEAARRRSIPVAIVGGSVPDGSSRAAWPARTLLRSTWARLTLAGASSAEDAARLIDLGLRLGAVRVTGDPGVDSAAARADGADPDAWYLAPFHRDRRLTVVAGSTWPADETVLLPALAGVRDRIAASGGAVVERRDDPRPVADRPAAGRALRIVIAPHEPSPERVASLIETLGADGWQPTTLGALREGRSLQGHDAVVVDSVGQLAHMYTVGDIAYVGGGFHDQGLHSVLEPAAAGIPIVFGPRHENARAAGHLARLGGAKIAFRAGDVERFITDWLADGAARAAAASSAYGYIDEHRGAAARTAELLRTLIDRPHRHDPRLDRPGDPARRPEGPHGRG